MEPNFFLSGSDNFFKYLFTVGAVMIVISILYPLQKSQEIEMQRTDLVKESELLNNEIRLLNNEYQKNAKEYADVSATLDSLVSIFDDKVLVNEQFLKLRKRGNEIIQKLNDRERELEIKNIIVKNEKLKIDLLEEHSESYKNYYLFIKGIGIFFLIIGFVGWSLSTFVKEKIQWTSLQEKFPKKKKSMPSSKERRIKESNKEDEGEK